MTTRTVVKFQLGGKSVSAAVGILGSAALLCNVGTRLPTPAFLRGGDQPSGGPGSGRPSVPDIDRADMLMDRMLSIPEVNERYLMFGNKALDKGYYELFGQVGDGICANAEDKGYDHVSNTMNSVDMCAKFCGKHLLYAEHKGFNYNPNTDDCQCIFNDHRIPRPLQKKSEKVVVDPHAIGDVMKVTLSGGDGAGYSCYRKATAKLGSSLDRYTLKNCATDDGEKLEIASFTAFDSESCADICVRFSLMPTHKGFTVEVEGHCKCLFKEGEMPTARKLSFSGADRGERAYDHTERYKQFLTPGDTQCYDRIEHLQHAAPEKRIKETDIATSRVFINEFHFRNFGVNEPFLRVVGPKGADAAKYKLLSYQGRDGSVWKSTPLSGTFQSPDGHQHFGYVKLDLDTSFVRNGKQAGDGFALVDTDTGGCLQFISYASESDYDRSFEATDGECEGKASVPIGVTEPRDTPVGKSLQLTGSGNNYPAFAWAGPADASTTTANVGQDLTAP